jgi:hypothetical protein
MKMLRSFAALAVTAMLLQGLPVKAQDSTSGSSSTSGSGSTSSSSSGASTTSGTSGNQQQQRARQNNSNSAGVTLNQNTPGAQSLTSSGSLSTTSQGSGSYNNNNSGFTSSDVTVRTTPTVYAPPVSGGNPCTLAVSGGVSVIGWGAAAGGTFVDEDCANRQKIAMIHNAGYAAAARELMCNDKATYLAFRGTATPCAARPQFDGPASAQPIVQQQPQPITRTTSAQPFQPAGRFACMDARGREVASGTPGASCGYI